ncbi:MAG: hypothetical protein Q7S26_03840 [bacterium]|nr:hypothetical protein [bacterium]
MRKELEDIGLSEKEAAVYMVARGARQETIFPQREKPGNRFEISHDCRLYLAHELGRELIEPRGPKHEEVRQLTKGRGQNYQPFSAPVGLQDQPLRLAGRRGDRL